MLDSEKMKESNNVITSENSLPSIAYQPSIQNNIVSQDSGFSTLSTVSTQPAESILGNNLLVSGSSTISPFQLPWPPSLYLCFVKYHQINIHAKFGSNGLCDFGEEKFKDDNESKFLSDSNSSHCPFGQLS
jgi:hypothetical protein